MPEHKSFEFESLQDARSIKAFLENLMEGINRQRIILSTEREEMELLPKNPMKFTVKARQKKGEGRISIKISWKDSESFSAASISLTAR